MAVYILRRLLLMIPTLLGVTIVVFAISRIAPGDPFSSTGLSGDYTASEQAGGIRASDIRNMRLTLYGLDKPLHIQYAHWLRRVACLDFGNSIKHHRPVIGLIKERLPVTLALNIMAFIIVYSISLPLGILAAVRHGRLFDRISSLIVLTLWSLPVMLVGQILIGFFAGPTFKNWFPPAGLSGIYAEELPFLPWLADRLWHLVLPVLCLSYTGFAYLTKQVRSAMLDNLSMDYIRTARAKGLPETTIILRHAFYNSAIRLITIMATLLPAMLTGSVIVEKIFSIPGMGLLAFEAVANRDYNVVMAVTTIAAICNSIALLLCDIAYAVADPRVTFEGRI